LIEPGLWRIPLAMPVGPAFVNVYLLRAADGWILIDTGMGFPPVFAELAAALATPASSRATPPDPTDARPPRPLRQRPPSLRA